jgi:glutamate synthase domain-containing protein 1
VPVNIRLLGEKAASTLPRMEQVLIGRPHGLSDDEYERRLFLSRNEIEKRAAEDQIKHFYIPSFSHRLIGYKGLLVSPSLEKFYKDLQNPTTRRRSASTISATRRIPSRHGRSASPSGCSRTMARSTPGAAM